MGMTRRFESKRCLVAGGSLGDAIAARLRTEGGTVARLEDPATTDAAAVAAVATALEELGGLEVLVTAFGFRNDQPFLEIDDGTWARSLDVNLKSAFLVGREAARAMVAAGGGTIVHVSSDVAARPGPGTAAYAAAKAGVNLMMICMALDLAPDRVRVCAVGAPEDGAEPPGHQALGPEDVAAAVAFCASDDASYVLGSTFYLNGPLPIRG